MLYHHPTSCLLYLQLVDHLIKEFPGFWAVGVLKIIFNPNLHHNGLQVTAHTCVGERNDIHISIEETRIPASIQKQFTPYGDVMSTGGKRRKEVLIPAASHPTSKVV